MGHKLGIGLGQFLGRRIACACCQHRDARISAPVHPAQQVRARGCSGYVAGSVTGRRTKTTSDRLRGRVCNACGQDRRSARSGCGVPRADRGDNPRARGCGAKTASGRDSRRATGAICSRRTSGRIRTRTGSAISSRNGVAGRRISSNACFVHADTVDRNVLTSRDAGE